MSFSQTDLDAIDGAIGSGELTVKSNGKEVTYRSVSELLRARKTIMDAIQAQAGGARLPTIGGAGFSVARFD